MKTTLLLVAFFAVVALSFAENEEKDLEGADTVYRTFGVFPRSSRGSYTRAQEPIPSLNINPILGILGGLGGLGGYGYPGYGYPGYGYPGYGYPGYPGAYPYPPYRPAF